MKSKLWTCNVCGGIHPRAADDPPPGWATGSQMICSADCMRTLYSGSAIAHIFPEQATEEELADLRAHEDRLAAQTREAPPMLAGSVLGKIFAAREARYNKKS